MTSDTFELTKPDREALVHDLRVAATHHDEYADRASWEGMRATAGAFTRQAAQARELADRLEIGRYVRIGREVIPEA